MTRNHVSHLAEFFSDQLCNLERGFLRKLSRDDLNETLPRCLFVHPVNRHEGVFSATVDLN